MYDGKDYSGNNDESPSIISSSIHPHALTKEATPDFEDRRTFLKHIYSSTSLLIVMTMLAFDNGHDDSVFSFPHKIESSDALSLFGILRSDSECLCCCCCCCQPASQPASQPPAP